MEFDQAYQVELLQRFSDRGFMEQVGSLLRAEFFLGPCEDAAGELLGLYHKHRRVLSRGQVRQVLRKHGVDAAKHVHSGDAHFDREEVLRFARSTTLREAMVKAGLQNERGNPEKAVQIVAECPLHWPKVDRNGSADILKQDRRLPGAVNLLSTGLPTLDEYLKGGVWGGDLTVIMASTGGGKTSFLIWMAAQAVIKGKKVCFITLEQPDYEIEERFRRCLCDSPIVPKPSVWSKMRKHLLKGGASLEVIEYSPQGIGVMDLDREFKAGVDCVFIDYADYLRPPSGSQGMEYHDLGMIYSDLKAIAMRRRIPVVTASQVNRPAYGQDVFNTADVEASLRKVMIADRVIALSQTPSEAVQDDETGLSMGTLYLAKNRKGVPFKKIPITIDFARSHFREGRWA